MNLTLHQLKAFQAIAKFQSITKAAEAMNMTQPAVSIQLKNLQEQFEVPLTEIIGKKIHINFISSRKQINFVICLYHQNIH